LRQPKQTPYSFDGSVVVMFGAFGEKFGGANLPVGAQCYEIGERAAAVDPDVPTRLRHMFAPISSNEAFL
jgi:hypothetical protein